MKRLLTLALAGILFAASAQAQVSSLQKDFGKESAFYAGGHGGLSDTNLGVGAGGAYGADAAYLERFDWSTGSAYAGAGPFYLGSTGLSGVFNTVGGQFLAKYEEIMLAVLFGATWMSKVSDATANPYFGWGARLTWDFPVFSDKVTIGPGATVLVASTTDNTYYNWGFVLGLKVWW